jgi:hypothetical protein
VKPCIGCGKTKDLSDYYRHPSMADGHLNRCKECQKRVARSTREADPDYYKAYDRNRSDLPHRIESRKAYYASERGQERQAAGAKAWAARNPAKRAAQHAVNNAVRDGRLQKLPCEVCGDTKSHGHHPDYTKHLEVIWLCAKHHSEEHKRLRDAA